MAAVHANLQSFESVKALVHCSRGVSLASSVTRKSPNAFQFVRQIEVLEKAGEAEQSFRDT